MNTVKKINVNYSSLVGLKAELLRKQAEVSEAKAKTETVQSVPKPKLKNKRPKGDGKTEHVTQELTDVDDINAHKKSKLMLEAKARLYERLKKSKHNNESFLVDFTTKSDESEEEHFKEEDYDDSFSDPEDSWVEYEDCFGRTRKCLRKDLPLMQKKDDVVKQQIMKRKEEADNDKHERHERPKFVPQEKEPEIEIMRRKWEEQTQKLSEKADIHYQDILFDEARAHGVGYYAFSQDEEERTKQQQNLANLRKQTEQKQKEMKELKELRDKMEQNRLKAARIRRRIRAGLPAEPTEEEIAQENMESNTKENICNTTDEKDDSMDKNDKEKIKNIKDEEKDKAKEELVTIENKIKAFGELLGKKTEWREMSQEEWVDKCRGKRIKEFGPVYDNFHRAGYLEGAKGDGSRRISTEDADTECQSKDTELLNTDEKNTGISIQENNKNRTCILPENIQNDTDDDGDDDIIGPLPPTEFSSTEKCHSTNTTEISNLSSDKVQNLSDMSLVSSHTTPVCQLSPLSTAVPSTGVPPPSLPPPGVPPPSLPPPSMLPPGVPPPSMLPPGVPPPSMLPPGVPPSSMLSPGVPPPSLLPPSVSPSGIPLTSIPPLGIPPNSIPVPSVPPSPVPPPSIAIPPPSSVLGYHDPSNAYLYSNQMQTTSNVQPHEYFYAGSFPNPLPMTYMYPPYPLSHTSINTVLPPDTTNNTKTVPSTSTSNSEESSSINTELNTTESTHVMKEEDIAAGLKYLRDKFEKRQIS